MHYVAPETPMMSSVIADCPDLAPPPIFWTSLRLCSCLCLLDISAAFDTIDHNILLKRLSTLFGFTDTALTSRSFYVKTSEASSRSYPPTCGVPQGLVLGPFLCNLYTTPLSSIIKASSFDHHLHADDTQLFIVLLAQQLLRIHRSSTCSQANLFLDDLKSPLPEPLENRIYTHRSPRRTKENPSPIYFP